MALRAIVCSLWFIEHFMGHVRVWRPLSADSRDGGGELRHVAHRKGWSMCARKGTRPVGSQGVCRTQPGTHLHHAEHSGSSWDLTDARCMAADHSTDMPGLLRSTCGRINSLALKLRRRKVSLGWGLICLKAHTA